MRRPYGTAHNSGIYLTRHRAKLLAGDLIWVIEGDTSTPTAFSLVDCFRYELVEHPPFAPEYSRFSVRVAGTSLLARGRIALDKAESWFSELHGRFITKQRFFSLLLSEPKIVNGLRIASGV
jgi:hypothetical protein